MTSRLPILALMIMSLLLSACGWHLRGQADIPLSLRILHVEYGAADFTTQKLLKQSLLSNGVTLAADAEYILRITEDSSDRRTLSVTDSAKASEYELLQTLSFVLLNRQGQALMQPAVLKTYRSLLYDANAAIGKAQEEANLRREMKRDNVNKLLLRLQAIKVDKLKPIVVAPDGSTTSQAQ